MNSQTLADPDARFRQWLGEFAQNNPRQGYRKAYHQARAEGWMVNHKKVQRLWKEEGLRVPIRGRGKRVGASTSTVIKASCPGMVWAIDFQFDTDECGKIIKICSLVDEHTRESIGGLVERNITSATLIEHLEQLVAVRGYPMALRMDNGSEFISKALATWAGTKTGLVFIPPGQPWKNGHIESFNGRLRDECLNLNSFFSLLHARVIISDWKTNYNTARRHSSLGYKTPAEYAAACKHKTTTELT